MKPPEHEEIVAAVRTVARTMEEEVEALPHVEEALREAFRRHHRARAWRGRLVAGAIAASVVMLLVSAAVWLRRPAPAPQPLASRVTPTAIPAPPQTASAAPAREELRAPVRRRTQAVRPRGTEVGTGFLPVAGADPFEPLERGRLVRVRLPRVSLAAFGLPMNEDRAATTVTADVLLGEDGVARAIRFVQ